MEKIKLSRVGAVSYTICSKPDYITFDCPYCKVEDIEVSFDNVDFATEYWGDGALVTCPECGKEVELGDYDYD